MEPRAESVTPVSDTNPAQDRTEKDPKEIVLRGYDQIASRYLEWSVPSPARMGYLQALIDRLPKEANVLELGCGAGVPCTQILLQHARVVAVDCSAAQIALAK